MAITITKQPVNIVAEVGDTITFKVEATGAAYYRWYNRRIDERTWNRSSLTGYNTDTITIPVTSSRYDYLWRCTLTDASGEVAYSDAVQIHSAASSDGYVKYSTLAAIADAIKEKTKNFGEMLPSEMPGRIAAIATSKPGAMRYGKITVTELGLTTINVGTDLPANSAWGLVIMQATHVGTNADDLLDLYHIDVNGVGEGVMRTGDGSYTDHYSVDVNHDTGSISLGNGMEFCPCTYFWMYSACDA